MDNSGMGWFPTTATQPQSKNVFTTFIDSEESVKTYPVPAGAMVILIYLSGEDSKMYFKSTDSHGVPLPTRVFDISERVEVPPANPNLVTKEELNGLSQKVDELTERMNKFMAALTPEGGAK